MEVPGDNAEVLRTVLVKKELELKQLQDSFDEYTQSSQELEQELEQELARAEQQTAQLSKKATRLEQELDTVREKLDATQLEMRKCETELNALRSELTRVSMIRRQLEQEQDELTTQVRILQATEDDLRHKMEREMEEKVFLLSDQEELKREHELVTERLRTEIMDLKSELFAVQLKNETLQAESQQHRRDEQERRDAQDEEEEEQQVNLNYSARSSDEADRMDVDDDCVLPPRLSTLQERDQSDREQLIETLERELDVLSARLQEETEVRERLELDYLDAQDNLAQAEAMENEMAEMSEELIEKSQEIRQRDLEIQALQQTVTSLKAENSALMEENEELKAAVDKQEAARASTEDDEMMIDTLRSQCLQLEVAESLLRERLEEEELLTVQLREENQELVTQVDEHARLRTQLQEQLDTQVKKKQQELGAMKELNESLRRQLDSATRKAADLEVKASAVSVSSASSETSSSSTEGKSSHGVTSKESDSRRLLIEIQALRANVSSLQSENARLRNAEVSSSALLPNKRVSTDLLKLSYTPDQLAKKYLAERTRNAALLSRLQTVCGNIQVFCRVRPVIGEELAKCYGSRLGVNVINQSDVAAMDVRPDRVFTNGADGNQPPDADTGDLEMLDMNAAWKVFTFDRVIGPAETQMDVFREVEPIAQSVVEGFKACIFAYGQTGSGKTFTMEGTESDPGLNYRVISHIFQSIVLRGAIYDPDRMDEDSMAAEDAEGDDLPAKRELCYHIQVGVLEIYNETLRDLVNPENPKSLDIRQDPTTGDILVPELTMATATSPDQTISILRGAQANRVTGKTDVHAHSSRSHSVVIIQISTRTSTSLPSNQSDSDELMASYVSGKLYMVDLAGSERVKKSNVSGAMLKEAAHINKSLSALADVMEALDKKQAHVPYRNSKLTYLLQDVLNTSCKTVMIVNCGPTIESASETFRSLQLAERVRNIVVGRNSITKNKKDILSGKRAFSEIQSLKQQIQLSARKFKQSQQAVISLKREQKNHSDQTAAMLQTRVKTAASQLVSLRTQSETMKRINDELTEQLKHERDAKQKEADQREAAQRQLRQLNSKTRVSTSHQESLERQLKDREDEVKKLRQMLTEARQRTATSVIPRHKNSPPAKKARSENVVVIVAEPEDNQDENGDVGGANDMDGEVGDDENQPNKKKQPLRSASSTSTTSGATKIPMPKFGFPRQSSFGTGAGANISKKMVSNGKSETGSSKFRRTSGVPSNASRTTSGSSTSRQGWK